jgi:hypothetical protein
LYVLFYPCLFGFAYGVRKNPTNLQAFLSHLLLRRLEIRQASKIAATTGWAQIRPDDKPAMRLVNAAQVLAQFVPAIAAV